MKLINLSIFCLILFLFSGCTRVMHHNPDLSHDVKAQESEVNKDGIRLRVKCIYLKSEMKTYFDRDLVHYGILPIQIYMENKSYPRIVALDINGINLIDIAGAKNPIMSCKQIIDKMILNKLYLGQTVLNFTVLDPISIIIGLVETSDKIKKNQSSCESHSIKFGNLISGGVTEGFTFFNIPEDLNNLNGWKISVVLKDTETKNDIILDYTLSGTIVPPKKRSSAVEDHVDMK